MFTTLDKIALNVRSLYHRYCIPYGHLGRNVIVDSGVKIYNAPDMSLGDNVRLQEHVWLNAPQWEKREVLKIGSGCSIGRNCFITAMEKVELGESVFLAPNVFISDHSHRYDDPTKPIGLQENTPPKPVRIGSGTWIGINCVILPGVTIGEHCVIGANSLVNSSIPAYSVAVGSPARVIKRIPR